MKNNYYFLFPITNTKSEIRYSANKILQTHLDNQFPPISSEAAAILCEDLNEIHQKNKIKSATGSVNEQLLKSVYDDLLGEELRESFGYCILSTFMERLNIKSKYVDKIEIEPCIHWDRIYRINPQPPLLMNQMAVVAEIQNQIKSEWVDLPLNYCESYDEMQENEVGFVSKKIINELRKICKSFSNIDLFCVELLYQFIGRFSITVPILWVSGKIDNQTFVDAYRVFELGQQLSSRSTKQKDYAKFLNNRLEYLKRLRASIFRNDNILFKLNNSNNYKIISYSVANKNTNEFLQFCTDRLDWKEARRSAVESAILWKQESKLENKYQGIQLWLTYGIKDNPEHTSLIHILTGERMHSPEITQALWDEGAALNYMGYKFDAIRFGVGGFSLDAVIDSNTRLYYFTA
jgi:hypothetical protein